ncbi:hypothetical protein ACHAXR_011364, partial [Thalassiosira sp. AJA248-18]
KGLEKAHKGKCLLLASKAPHKPGQIPQGEEDFLWEYTFTKVNKDCSTVVIEFNNRYTLEEEGNFFNYVCTKDREMSIVGYKFSGIQDDHKLFNKILHRVNNKAINGAKEMKRQEEAVKRVAAAGDLSDLQQKIEERVYAYNLLVDEFQSDGPLETHAIAKGKSTGQCNYKQRWRHKYSSHTFMWHKVPGKTKTNFVSGKLWKAARVIIDKEHTGSERLRLIFQHGKKPMDAFGEIAVHPREVDMVNRVKAVRALAASLQPLSLFDGIDMRDYIRSLDPKHTPPHRLERLCLLMVFIDGAMMEFARIIEDARDDMDNGFMSALIDFWTDSTRREQYGVLVVNVVAERYAMDSGKELFMSLFATGRANAGLAVLEFPLNFEKFTKEKTIRNVVDWMWESMVEVKIANEDFGHLSTDGGPNAIGSIGEFELQGREDGRVNNLDFNICASHQNERSSDYASGIGGFVENSNVFLLGEILKKNHTTQTELNRHTGRMGVYGDVQVGKGQNPCIKPNPGVVTRWQSWFAEVKRGNMIMGDVVDTLERLLSPDGID